MELTKEYFDKQFSKLTTDVTDLRKIVATKDDVLGMQATLSADIKELRTEMNTKFEAMFELLNIRKDVEQLRTQMGEVRLKLA